MERGAKQFLTHLAVRAAPFGLLRNSPAQRSLTRPDSPEFLAVGRAEPALCGLLRNSPAQRSLTRPDSLEFLAVWRAEPALCGLLRICVDTWDLQRKRYG
jgi:hypothetical protein